MRTTAAIDLMPPAFEEGLDDWSRGDGTPDSPTYDTAQHARLAVNDPDFGTCLELRMVEPTQRLRYMGEAPIRHGGYFEISARLKALRGPRPAARIAAWPGGAQGRGVPGLVTAGRRVALPAEGDVCTLRALIGPTRGPGVDLVWDARVLYAHVGLDLMGPVGGVLRIESIALREVSAGFAPFARTLPGFGSADAGTGASG